MRLSCNPSSNCLITTTAIILSKTVIIIIATGYSDTDLHQGLHLLLLLVAAINSINCVTTLELSNCCFQLHYSPNA